MLSSFEKVGLSEMTDIAFGRRHESKFITSISQLPGILQQLEPHYSVLEIEANTELSYHSYYLDTIDLLFYHEHQRGIPRRRKIRFRNYIDTATSFFEIKKKDGRGRTLKTRIQAEVGNIDLKEKHYNFLSQYIPYLPTLHVSLENKYTRITLVHHSKQERITIDTGLSFQHNTREVGFSSLAIIEVKQSLRDRKSAIFSVLRSKGIRSSGFSKYCIGIASLYPNIQHNLLKPHFRKILKITA